MAGDTVTVELTQEEAAALQALLAERNGEGIAHPSGKEVTVQNESLGMNPHNGEKIQYRPGPGRELSPAPKGFDRWKAREARRLEAQQNAKARSEKNKKSIVIQVEDMKDRIKGRNVTDTIKLIELLNPHDREIAVLAEEQLEARKGVLQNPGFVVSRKVRQQFDHELEIINDLTDE